jgi:hypothetical protein
MEFIKNKNTVITLVIIAFSLIVAAPLYATEFTRENTKIEETLSDSSTLDYAYPEKIYITQVTSPNAIVSSDSELWYKHLYYYFVTRTGLTDIPYTVLVDRSGNTFEGASSGTTSSLFMDTGKGSIVIGYMSDGSDITQSASVAIKKLVEGFSAEYGLTKDNVEVAELTLNKSEGALSSITAKYSDTLFARNMHFNVGSYKYNSDPKLQFAATLEKDEYSFDAVAGESVTIAIDVTNSGDIPWFTDRFDLYLETSTKKDSDFAVNGIWESFQKVLLIEEDDGIVNPGESVRLSFQMLSPLRAGEYKESFLIKVLDGEVVTGSSFSVSFNASKGDFTLIRITDTTTGALNVRKGPYVNADLVAEVAVGKIFISKDSEAGWYKIEYSNGLEGWVYGKYTEVIQ